MNIAGRSTQLRPESVSAAVLSRLVANAEQKLNAKVSGAFPACAIEMVSFHRAFKVLSIE